MFWLIVGIALWGLLHSWTASLALKESLRQRLGADFMKFQRLFFNVFSVVSLAPILYLKMSLSDRVLYQIPAPWSSLMIAGQGFSAALLLISLLQTDVLSFAGLSQIAGVEKNSGLVTSGLYRVVRHPLYTFGLLTIWLSPVMSLNSLALYFAFTVYLLIGIVFEERKLLREFGEAYVEYRNATPMLIPGVEKFSGNK